MVNTANFGGTELTAVRFIMKLLGTSFIIYADRQLDILTFLIVKIVRYAHLRALHLVLHVPVFNISEYELDYLTHIKLTWWRNGYAGLSGYHFVPKYITVADQRNNEETSRIEYFTIPSTHTYSVEEVLLTALLLCNTKKKKKKITH